MAFADISLEEALVLEAYEEDILDEEETLLAFELLVKSPKTRYCTETTPDLI